MERRIFWLRVTCRPECLYCPAAFLTSVPEACFQCFVRKFHALYPCGLPYPRPVFCFLDGSFVLCTLADFRTRTPFSPFWTEVSCLVPFLTSVPEARFQCFVRKFRALQPSRLPYRESFSLLFGIFLEFTMPGHYYFQECSCGSVTRRDCSLVFRDQCICIHCFVTRQDSNSEFREQRICIQLAIRLHHSSC